MTTLVLTLLLCGSEPADAKPITAETLRQLPGIEKVEVFPAKQGPSHRIVHVKDWHFVGKDAFAADLRSQSDKPLTEEYIDQRYEVFLKEVEAVQHEQMELLRSLIRDHGIKAVHCEGLTDDDLPIYELRSKVLRENGERLAKAIEYWTKQTKGSKNEKTKKLLADLEDLVPQHRIELLRFGAAGRLYLAGEVEKVLPLEDIKAYRAANPFSKDGMVKIDSAKMEARQDEQVRRLLEAGPISIVVLGGGHDLSDNVQRLSKGKCEMITLSTKKYAEVTAEEEQ